MNVIDISTIEQTWAHKRATVESSPGLRFWAERFGGTLSVGSDQQRKVRYYVHRSELARIASQFHAYVERERRLR